MPKLDLDAFPASNATKYPEDHATVVRGRWVRRLAPATGLTDFGASHVRLEPGAWSSQRHWHEGEDELVVMIEGEATLVDNQGRHPMRVGDVAAFRKNDGNGHVLINETTRPCVFIAVGRPAAADCHYPDIDMHLSASKKRYVHKDGSEFAGTGGRLCCSASADALGRLNELVAVYCLRSVGELGGDDLRRALETSNVLAIGEEYELRGATGAAMRNLHVAGEKRGAAGALGYVELHYWPESESGRIAVHRTPAAEARRIDTAVARIRDHLERTVDVVTFELDPGLPGDALVEVLATYVAGRGEGLIRVETRNERLWLDPREAVTDHGWDMTRAIM